MLSSLLLRIIGIIIETYCDTRLSTATAKNRSDKLKRRACLALTVDKRLDCLVANIWLSIAGQRNWGLSLPRHLCVLLHNARRFFPHFTPPFPLRCTVLWPQRPSTRPSYCRCLSSVLDEKSPVRLYAPRLVLNKSVSSAGNPKTHVDIAAAFSKTYAYFWRGPWQVPGLRLII